MSEGLKYFVNNDGSEVLFDPLSGKYYTLVEDDQLAKNVNQQHQALNQSRKNSSSVKSSSHQSNRTVVQNNLNYQQQQQQKQKKQATTCQKNSEESTARTTQKTIVLTEQTSTARETEQVPLEETENEDKGIDTQMMIENFQRQEQMKTASSTLKDDAISESQGNNQNEQWETVQTRRNIGLVRNFLRFFRKLSCYFLTSRIQLGFNNVCSITIYDLSPTLR